MCFKYVDQESYCVTRNEEKDDEYLQLLTILTQILLLTNNSESCSYQCNVVFRTAFAFLQHHTREYYARVEDDQDEQRADSQED